MPRITSTTARQITALPAVFCLWMIAFPAVLSAENMRSRCAPDSATAAPSKSTSTADQSAIVGKLTAAIGRMHVTRNKQGKVVGLTNSYFKRYLRPLNDKQWALLASLRSLRRLDLTNQLIINDRHLKYLGQLPELTELNLHAESVTGEGLIHLNSLRKLRSLTLSRTKIADEHLVHLKKHPRLEELSLSQTGITDAGLKHLIGIKSIRKLDLGLTRTTDLGIRKLNGLINLTAIVLPYEASDACLSGFESARKLAEISVGFPRSRKDGNEKRLTVSGVVKLFERQKRTVREGLAALKFKYRVDQNRHVTALTLFEGTHTPRITDEVVAAINQLNKLTSLELLKTDVTDKGLAQLKLSSSLKSLNLSGTHCTDAGAAHIARFKSLELIVLPNACGDDAFRALANLTQLQAITVNQGKVTSAGLSHLRKLTKLEVLNVAKSPIDNSAGDRLSHLRRIRELNISDTEVNGEGLEQLGGLTTLAKLDLSGLDIRNDDLTHLKALKALQELKTDRTKVTFAGRLNLFQTLQQRTPVEILKLEGARLKINPSGQVTELVLSGRLRRKPRFSDGHLALAARFTQLQVVRVNYQRITATGLKHLTGNASLNRLVVYRCEGFDDAALKQIGTLKSLEFLSVTASRQLPLTDRGLQHLSGLKNLKSLYIRSPKVTPAGIKQLQARLPNCEIKPKR